MSVSKMKSWTILAIIVLSMMGCASKEAPQKADIENQGAKYKTMAADKTLRIVPEHYVGVRRIALKNSASPILQTRVTLRTNDSLQAVANMIMELVPVTVNIASDHDAKGKGTKESVAGSQNLNPQETATLAQLLQAEASASALPGDFPKSLNINYEGRLIGLLDQIALQTGYGWDFSREQNAITFARTMVRTFTLNAAPGKVDYENQLTNKSRESNSSSSIGGGVNSTVRTGDASSQIAQTYKSKLTFDIWDDTLKTVESMLSSIGKATPNQGAGTITVRDRPENIRQITAYIDEVNSRYARQVALKVNVYALEVNDDSSAGIDLQMMFTNKDVAITAGNLSTIGTIGTASATIVSGDLKNSQAILKALRQWGDAKQITSSGIVAMNNQPAPVEAVKRISYLAGSSIGTTDYGQTTELTPGEVTTGFSMTVTPHIMQGRRVILQYNVRLSALDSMETFSGGDVEIQLPQVSTRAFSQRAAMMMGQTLVLAGFEQAVQTQNSSTGLLSLGKGASYSKTLLVITIEVENASPEIAQEAA